MQAEPGTSEPARSRRTRVPHSARVSPLAGPALLALAAAALLVFGVIGVGRTTPRFGEFTAVYAGGRVWLAGGNPYDAAQYAPAIRSFGVTSRPTPVFAYSPAAAPFTAAAALLSLPDARVALLLANLLALAALAWLMARFPWDARAQSDAGARTARGSALAPWLLASLMVGNPFTMKGIYLGQNTLLVAAALAGAWYLSRRGAWLGGGVLLGLCSVKPQIAVLAAVWLALEGRWKLLGAAAATALLLAAFPFVVAGIGPTVAGWRSALAVYATLPPNLPGDAGVLGLPSLLAAWGLPAPSPLEALLMTVCLTGVLWAARARFSRSDVFCVLIALPAALVFGHPYDVVLLVPLLGALALRLAERPALWPAGAVLAVALMLPDRLTARVGAPQGQWVTLVALPLLAAMLALGHRPVPRYGRELSPADS